MTICYHLLGIGIYFKTRVRGYEKTSHHSISVKWCTWVTTLSASILPILFYRNFNILISLYWGEYKFITTIYKYRRGFCSFVVCTHNCHYLCFFPSTLWGKMKCNTLGCGELRQLGWLCFFFCWVYIFRGSCSIAFSEILKVWPLSVYLRLWVFFNTYSALNAILYLLFSKNSRISGK